MTFNNTFSMKVFYDEALPSEYNIVVDVMSGLHYVHHECGRMVLHHDIKVSNVLLDASFRARLGDFGLACVIEFDQNSFTDLGVADTRGYIAPEYSVLPQGHAPYGSLRLWCARA